jgi:hypothetical protein
VLNNLHVDIKGWEKFLDILSVETSDIIRHHCIRGIVSQGNEMKTGHAD